MQRFSAATLVEVVLALQGEKEARTTLRYAQNASRDQRCCSRPFRAKQHEPRGSWSVQMAGFGWVGETDRSVSGGQVFSGRNSSRTDRQSNNRAARGCPARCLLLHQLLKHRFHSGGRIFRPLGGRFGLTCCGFTPASGGFCHALNCLDYLRVLMRLGRMGLHWVRVRLWFM